MNKNKPVSSGKHREKPVFTQRRTVGNSLPIERRNSERTFIIENPNSFSPIVSPEDLAALEEYKKGDPIKQLFDLSKFELDKPIVDDEEASVIKSFYEKNTLNNNKDDHSWIQTFSGRKFFPLNPYIDAIVIQDIAHSLSMQCRFTGHCKFFYSIAQHCVLVSYLCDEIDQLHGLLHDASEAYLTDIPSPLKRTPEFSFYKVAEKHLQSMIYRRFGLSEQEPASVKRADVLMLSTEATNLFQHLHSEWKVPCPPLPIEIKPMTPAEAEKLFLDRFDVLFKKAA